MHSDVISEFICRAVAPSPYIYPSKHRSLAPHTCNYQSNEKSKHQGRPNLVPRAF